MSRLVNRNDFDEFSNQLQMAGIEIPENLELVINITYSENVDWMRNNINTCVSKHVKINTVSTGFHKFKIQVD